MARVGLLFWLGPGLVEAATVNIGDFPAHGTEVGTQLAAMVNHVMEHELEIEHGRVIVNAEEGPGSGPVFAGKFAHLGEFRFEAIFVQGHNVLGGGEVRGHGIVVHLEFAGKESIEKPDIGRSEVPGEFECAARVGVRPITLLGDGNRFENAASG